MCDALSSYVFSISAAEGEAGEFVVYLVTGGNPSSGMELYNYFKARPQANDHLQYVERRLGGRSVLPGFPDAVWRSSFMVHQIKFWKTPLPDRHSYSDLKKVRNGAACSGPEDPLGDCV
jgi:hypothetical protein